MGIKQAHCTVRQCADAAAMECMYYSLYCVHVVERSARVLVG